MELLPLVALWLERWNADEDGKCKKDGDIPALLTGFQGPCGESFSLVLPPLSDWPAASVSSLSALLLYDQSK